MKKIILAVACSLFAFTISAQPISRSEVSVSYGLFPATTWVDSFSDIWVNIFTGSEINRKDWGAVTVGYNYRVLKRLSIGVDLSYASNTAEFTSDGNLWRTQKNNYWSIMPNLRYSWLNVGILSLYSRAGVGVSCNTTKVDNNTKSSTHLAFQVSPLGIQVGGKISGFVEGGVGMSGSLIAGIRCRF